MLIPKVAWRNIFRQKRRTILTMLTMFGGFVLSALSIGWADGTYNNIIDLFTRNRLGHIQIHAAGYLDKPSMYKNIPDYENVGVTIAGIEGVEAWAPRLYSAGLASIEEKTAGVQIIGIDPEWETVATRFNRKIIKGKSFSSEACHEVILGKGAANTLKAQIGSEIVIVSQGADGSIANDLYTVTGIVASGDMAQDQTAFYLHLQDAQELLVLEGVVHEIVIIAERLGGVRSLADRIEASLGDPGLDVEPWQEFARSFYVAMKADKDGGWIMIFIVIMIVAIGVLNTVLMTVLERTREYGVLRAVGTRPAQVFRLVVFEVCMMAMISIMVGCAVGLPLNYLLSINGIPMPQTFTYGGMEFTHYYSEVNAHSMYIPAVTVLLSAMLVCIFPALKAARIEPARAMRIH